MYVSIYSFNARGLANKDKRVATFSWLKTKRSGIFLIQETHSIEQLEKIWRQQWDGPIFFQHGKSNSRGVAILVTKNIDFVVNTIDSVDDGRFLLIDCAIFGTKYILVNIYAPTIDKRTEQTDFGSFLFSKVEKFLGCNIIVGGDFNINIERLKISTKNFPANYDDYILNTIEILDLVDIWKLQHPDTDRYTRHEKTRYGFRQSRIDFFVVPSFLEFTIDNTDIIPGFRSDHSLLSLTLNVEDTPTRGPGLWKLNISLLQNEDYVDLIKQTIHHAKQDSENLTDKSLIWDYIKCRIRTESISYAIAKQRKDNTHIEKLNLKLNELQEICDCTPTPQVLNEMDTVKADIEHYFNERARGSIIRSRCKIVDEDEKPSKYFLNLEKSNQMKRNIRTLMYKGERITNQEKILTIQREFYEKLYSQDSNYTLNEYNNFLQKITFPTISQETKATCEAKITLDEIKEAINDLPNNKSPGTDGLPIEFYKFFGNDILDILSKSFENSFELGHLSNSQRKGVLCLIPKKGKDLTKIESWRPLSILNTDYKIITKVLAKRLKKNTSRSHQS